MRGLFFYGNNNVSFADRVILPEDSCLVEVCHSNRIHPFYIQDDYFNKDSNSRRIEWEEILSFWKNKKV